MARPRKAKGLGDTIEQITEVTGIKKLVEFIAGEDCGCQERKEKLNQLFPYGAQCLTEEEYNYLTKVDLMNKTSVSPIEQKEILKIYGRVFNKRQEPTSCASCWIQIIKDLQKVYSSYEA
jgi:hypothetical protein